MSYLTDRASGVTPGAGRLPWPWVLLAMGVVVVWCGASGANGFTPPGSGLAGERWGYLVGYVLGGAVAASTLVWIVLSLAVLRRTGGSASLAFVLLLLAGIVSGGAGAVVGGGSRALDAREVNAAVQANMAMFDEATAGFDAEGRALGLAGALTPAELKTDRDLSRAKAKIDKADDLVERRRRAFYEIADKARARLAALDIDAGAKRQVLAEFDQERDKVGREVEADAALERTILAELDAYADFLARRRGAWRVRGEMIEFSTDADFATFTLHQQNLQRLGAAAERRKRELAAERAAAQAR